MARTLLGRHLSAVAISAATGKQKFSAARIGRSEFPKSHSAVGVIATNPLALKPFDFAVFVNPLLITAFARVCVPLVAATFALVRIASTHAVAENAATQAAQNPARRDEHAVQDRYRAVYEEHAVSVVSGMESVAVSPGYGTHMSRRVNSSAAVVSVTFTMTAVS